MGIGIRLIIVTVIALFPVRAYAHPGKTDVRGGHKCWKGCGQWELYYGEYHLHDKDFRPIRLDQPPPAELPDVSEPIPALPTGSENLPEQSPEPAVQPLPKPVYRQPGAAPLPAEESTLLLDSFTIALLLILLVLVVVLLMIRNKLRRRRLS